MSEIKTCAHSVPKLIFECFCFDHNLRFNFLQFFDNGHFKTCPKIVNCGNKISLLDLGVYDQ
jgi:hypothetical protein